MFQLIIHLYPNIINLQKKNNVRNSLIEESVMFTYIFIKQFILYYVYIYFHRTDYPVLCLHLFLLNRLSCIMFTYIFIKQIILYYVYIYFHQTDYPVLCLHLFLLNRLSCIMFTYIFIKQFIL